MLQHNSLPEQHHNQFSFVFSTGKVGQLLRKAGIRKTYGVSTFAVFRSIFQLVFQGRNPFRMLESKRGETLPGKDVVYRFLNETCYNWRRFYQFLGFKVVSHFESLTSAHRIRVFIIDESVMSRQRSKKVH